MQQETRLTELINFIEDISNAPKMDAGFTTPDEWIKWAANIIRNKAISLLPAEREDYEFQYRNGVINTVEQKEDFLESKKHFDTYFKQYKTEEHGR